MIIKLNILLTGDIPKIYMLSLFQKIITTFHNLFQKNFNLFYSIDF